VGSVVDDYQHQETAVNTLKLLLTAFG